MSNQTPTQTSQAQSDQQPLAESTAVMRQTSQLPFTQLFGFQRAMAEMFRSSIDMTDWARSQTLSLTKQGLDNYIEFLEQTAGGTEEMAQAGIEQLQGAAQMQQDRGQQQQAQNGTVQAGQQFTQPAQSNSGFQQGQPAQANPTPVQQPHRQPRQQWGGSDQFQQVPQGQYHYAGQQPQRQWIQQPAQPATRQSQSPPMGSRQQMDPQQSRQRTNSQRVASEPPVEPETRVNEHTEQTTQPPTQ